VRLLILSLAVVLLIVLCSAIVLVVLVLIQSLLVRTTKVPDSDKVKNLLVGVLGECAVFRLLGILEARSLLMGRMLHRFYLI